MKHLLGILAICTLTACPALADDADDEGDTPPNILLIVAEDMSSRVGAFGDLVARTPAIDALASEGLRFTNVFTASGVCAPSRSALITGVYPQSMGTQQMRTSHLSYQAVPPPDVKAFPELLRRAGYATANTVKTDYQFGDPFTIWDANVGDFTTPPDLALWRRLPGNRPFFAMINLMSTHESRLATPDTVGAGPFQPLVDGVVAFRAEHVEAVTPPQDVVVPPYYPDTAAVRQSIAQHYDNVHYMDGQVQRVLDNLAADGLSGETIVIWTTDHGDGLPRAKRSIYDSGLEVPLIIRFPDGHGAGGVDQRLVSFVDLAPTILRLAGAEVPAFIQGRSFLAGAGRARDYVFAGRDRMDDVPDWSRAARDDRYKYIRNHMPEAPYFRPLAFRDMFPVMRTLWKHHEAGTLNDVQRAYFTAPRPTEELYDTVADPFEIHNLVGQDDYRATLERLRAAMDQWLERVGDRSREPEREMISGMWPGGTQPATAAPEADVTVNDSGQTRVSLRSPTPGASIGYRVVDQGAGGGSWALYTGPVALPAGGMLQAKAIRYGYQESQVIEVRR